MDQLINETYYHGSISRGDATDLVQGCEDGSFLLRKSLRSENSYAITIAFQQSVLHYSVQFSQENGMYSVNHGSEHPTPQALCQYYMKEKGGLKTKLLYPVGTPGSPTSPTLLPITKPTRSYSNISYEEQEWYHGPITRQEDAVRLSHAYRETNQNGIYLVRFKQTGEFVLSVVNDRKVHRYKILLDPVSHTYAINGKPPEFLSLEQLLHYHETQPSEISHLQCRLTMPCKNSSFQLIPPNVITHLAPNDEKTLTTSGPKAKKSILSGIASKSKALAAEFKSLLPSNGLDMNWSGNPPPVSPRSTASEPSLKLKIVQPIMDRFKRSSLPKDSIGYISPLMSFTNRVKLTPDLYISRDQLILRGEIGKGHFGSVKVGECRIMDSSVPCAIKHLTGSDIVANKNDLLKEAKIMQGFDHPYIVRLLAVCDDMESSGSLMMVLELAPLGSLKQFLSGHDDSSFPENRLLILMNQVCDGMDYLSSRNIVHRDLAARNILLVTENFAKISDFGMSRILLESENYYKASEPGMWPLRWYAPESLLYYKFTSKSEIWSFGVTLWEVFSYGSRPYCGMKGKDVLDMLERGRRLECPCGCSPGVYTIMLQCWAYEPAERPTFKDLLVRFNMLMQ